MAVRNVGHLRAAITPRLLTMALSFRIFLILLMAFSDATIPDHNPGDDVVRFDLRFQGSQCFCLEGLACDPGWKSYANNSRRRCVQMRDTSHETFVSQVLFSFILPPMTKWDSARFLHLAADAKRREPSHSEIYGNPFLDSEQAHAFFPLFPWCIRKLALLLIRILPPGILPPTFEGVLVLSALLINTISFAMALVFLVDLTLRLTLPNDKAVAMAGTVAMMFCLNPASIFFATTYSESLFSMFTFAGYDLYTAGYAVLAVLPWMAASYTRSNGCLVALWLLLQGIASSLQTMSRKPTLSRGMVLQSIHSFAFHGILAIAVVAPALWHDRSGYSLHCHSHQQVQPNWCHQEKVGSLYALVQSSHWNVGFLRYYELKQIPNFLLATPILLYSLAGVSTWIRCSWKERWMSKVSINNRIVHRIMHWTVWALRRSQAHNVVDENISMQYHPAPSILHGRTMLQHFSILAASALLALTVAHIQIATRIICSTCPAIYWHLAALYHSETRFLGFSNRLMIRVYLCVYIVMGTILHVNFLPWT